MNFNSIEEIIEDLAEGKMVIIVDDEDRENEGDFLMAASKVRTEDINFFATYGRGLVCMPITAERCKQLALPLMVAENNEEFSTNFTVSIEAAEGVTTGISAYDRALTIRAAVAPDATSKSIVQPGHIFPLMAQPGGVLTRAGHTEAGVDLARLAGLEPAAAIVEILNEDGSMARRDDLFKISEKHNIKIGTIEELIRYRVQNEKTIVRKHEAELKTEFGKFKVIGYKDDASQRTHLALVKGEVKENEPVLVRVHVEDTLCDMLSLQEEGCSWPLRDVMQIMEREEQGVIVVLRGASSGSFLDRLREIDVNHEKQAEYDESSPTALKTFGIGAQILSDVGVTKMRVMSAPKHFHGLAGFGLEIVEYVSE
ncbi:bifunctional 3,4-dihydroxy-2-butanone-4-phosphate synthase/GTP cyclohydrolase II [uncultured Cocleimonas sp.]|uniref:bifunctional 3,4-dihydroxy-2-butanone-4-phosphate synthase/GTP cyclohydrolase II n=1 Tax=uncultured Cocleimonas sp. TaxID=1051587 RepID=UPI002630BBE7|nr:bifunctional 3,4-dihydroxy-2-butanone-4-phosphate synthase/GTP cyclohydrolase II [uncultured Cocleimonas sp.]